MAKQVNIQQNVTSRVFDANILARSRVAAILGIITQYILKISQLILERKCHTARVII